MNRDIHWSISLLWEIAIRTVSATASSRMRPMVE